MSEGKRRSDYGKVRATERDLYLLNWIGEQFAVNTDQLKILMNRWKRSQEPEWRGKSVSDETVKWLLKRWRRAGWIENRKLLAHRPQWVWLSKEGLDAAGLPYSYLVPKVGRLNHIYLVNMVRLYTEGKLGHNGHWVCERQVNAERKEEKKKHMVDGEVIERDTVIGVEVEHTQKSKRRLAAILFELDRDYEVVWYVVTETAIPAVREAISKREGTDDEKKWRTFTLDPLPKILAAVV